MMQDRRFEPFKFQPDSNAAGMIALFLRAWEESLTAYERLLSEGLHQDDAILARDATYARLLKAGQTIRWIGGASAVRNAARLMARQVPSGDIAHFGRLWSGLLPSGQA